MGAAHLAPQRGGLWLTPECRAGSLESTQLEQNMFTHVHVLISSPTPGSCQHHRPEQTNCSLRSVNCTFSSLCDWPRCGGNQDSAKRPKPGIIYHKAAITQKPQNQSTAEGKPLLSTWANIHPKWALKGARCVGMLTLGAKRRSGGLVTLTLR